MAIEIICPVRQDLNLRDKNFKLDLSIIVSVSLSNKLVLKDWNCRTHNRYIESRRAQVRLQEESFMKEKVLRYAQIRSTHETGEMKGAQRSSS